MRSLAILLALSSPVAAAPATVDWAHGLVTAEGIGLADRHAPNPAVARGTARRGAEEAARTQLAAKLAALPLAKGGTVGDARKRDKAIAARLDAAIERALTIDAEPETDGAWTVTLAVPVEAVRQAIDGPRALAVGAADTGDAVVIVDGVTGAKPAVGWTVGGTSAATVWVDALPAWAKDAPHVKASAAKDGAIEIAGTTGSAATLFVIVTRK